MSSVARMGSLLKYGYRYPSNLPCKRNEDRTSIRILESTIRAAGCCFMLFKTTGAPCLTMCGKRVCLSRGKQGAQVDSLVVLILLSQGNLIKGSRCFRSQTGKRQVIPAPAFACFLSWFYADIAAMLWIKEAAVFVYFVVIPFWFRP